jgi:hypothetical protein
MANIRQSRPVYGRVFLAKVLRFFKALPLCLEAVWKGVNRFSVNRFKEGCKSISISSKSI